jgi:hypothetical protein
MHDLPHDFIHGPVLSILFLRFALGYMFSKARVVLNTKGYIRTGLYAFISCCSHFD